MQHSTPHSTNGTVRQENERLMIESMNRAKFAKNFTNAAVAAASYIAEQQQNIL